ncbi:SRPBCC family protein [Leptolyngbya sp. FACHB-261]|uniref:SRPBCC family protein n=1 Tax=Leptolyngbya sp. FACHB-261 TaxID=2692806 RepID=UPI001686FE3B|nr:SRPBCC family protein [Leptolyngbya sp. FACHB-261]MBD2100144.1 SRPBCC family protein [Leptolyngbya sp. FACHB-261]
MHSTNESADTKTEFEQSITVNAAADSIFAFISDVKNVPQYLPTIKNAQPQEGERIRTQGQVGDHSYDSDGHFRVDQQARRLQWGSDGENDYNGWLEVQGNGGPQSEVKVHIHYAPRPEMAQKMAERSPGHSFEAAMHEGISKTLESIKRICEGKGGKEEIAANQ